LINTFILKKKRRFYANRRQIHWIEELLKVKTENTIIMSFSKIESLIGDSLPESACKYRAFWANTRTHSVVFVRIDTGYKTIDVDFKRLRVTFNKV
jgi:hypothetical protein